MRSALRVIVAMERMLRASPALIPLLFLCASCVASAQDADTAISRDRFGSRLTVEFVRFDLTGSVTLPGDPNRSEVSHSAFGSLFGADWLRVYQGSAWHVSLGFRYALPFIGGALKTPSFSVPISLGLGFDLGSRFRTDFELTPEFAYYTFQTDTLEWMFRDASVGVGVSAGISYRISDSEIEPRLQLMTGVTLGALRSVTYNHNGTLLDLEVNEDGKFLKLPSVRLSYLMWFP